MTYTQDVTTLVTKLGPARRVPRSRIWLEGTRLVNAGFTVGAAWHLRSGTDGVLRLVLGMSAGLGHRTRRVSGKRGTHPIIDITGTVVTRTFPNADRVTVTFRYGHIVVTT